MPDKRRILLPVCHIGSSKMALASFILATGLAAISPAIAQDKRLVGIYGGWGAFRGNDRCYAMAEPDSAAARGKGAFAAFTFWPNRAPRGQVSIALRKPRRAGSAILLSVDGAPMQLAGAGRLAWAPTPAADAAIQRAVRTGVRLRIETRAESGERLIDSYTLRGAASAIDAAAIACAKGGPL